MMIRTLELAIAKISRLPDADQEEIGRKLLSHIEKLNALRAELGRGLGSPDAGDGRPLNLEEFLCRSRHSR